MHYAAGGVVRNIDESVSKLGKKPFMVSALGSDMSGEQFDSMHGLGATWPKYNGCLVKEHIIKLKSHHILFTNHFFQI